MADREPVGLAGWCKHGVGMLDDCDACTAGTGWHWESDGKGGWVSAPRCHEPTCPDFGSFDFGEGTCPEVPGA